MTDTGARDSGEDAPSEVTSRYVLLRKLGVGGMAEVHLARREGLAGFRQIVAFKRVLPHLADDAEFVEMFLQEARLVANLRHANIAQVIDFGRWEGRYYLAIEFVHGSDLRGLLRRARGPLPLATTLHIAARVADGLHHAHQATTPDGRALGLIHRDVSPSNVLLGHDGEVKILDFGIAKATALTSGGRTTSLKGKIAYMSPEHARGEPMDRRADLYALGLVMYEMLTGVRAVRGGSEYELLHATANGDIVPLEAVAPDLPAELLALVGRLLDPDAAKRPASAAEVSEGIEQVALSLGLVLSPRTVTATMEMFFGSVEPIRIEIEPDLPTVPDERRRPAIPPLSTRSLRERFGRVPRWLVLTGASALFSVGIAIGLAFGFGRSTSPASPEAPPRPEPSAGSPAGPPGSLAPEPPVAAGSERVETPPEPAPAATPAEQTARPSIDDSDRDTKQSRRSSHRPSKSAKRRADPQPTRALDRWLPPRSPEGP